MTARELARLVRNAARRVAVGSTAVAGACWWALTYLALGGAGLELGTAALVASGLAAAAGWLLSGE